MTGRMHGKLKGLEGLIAYRERAKAKKTLPPLLCSTRQVLSVLEKAIQARGADHSGSFGPRL